MVLPRGETEGRDEMGLLLLGNRWAGRMDLNVGNADVPAYGEGVTRQYLVFEGMSR